MELTIDKKIVMFVYSNKYKLSIFIDKYVFVLCVVVLLRAYVWACMSFIYY